MIPSTVGFLDQDFEIETQPSLTYKMDLDGDSVRGLVDEQDAMKQMIFRTLQTERYQYIIYPWYYGIETHSRKDTNAEVCNHSENADEKANIEIRQHRQC